MSLTGIGQKELGADNLNDKKLKRKMVRDAIADFTLALAIVVMIYAISQIL